MSTVTPEPGGSGELLVAIHDHLRHELVELRSAAAALAQGRLPLGEVREQVRDSQLRRTFAQLGAFCQMYCRFVHGHHGIEDARMYPDLLAADPSLQPVVDELTADHVRIGGLLRTLDDELARTHGADDTVAAAQRVAVALEALAEALVEHLRVEEEALVPALDRLRLLI
ncbi:hemerythrin domain-containing protein [Jannaschia sp. R86511]|uniref:hemerythrin domain-containing protein n=1 Tax=Jannaschia sp. R86511 TaxID=3093853 RepID=UPI0036D23CEF